MMLNIMEPLFESNWKFNKFNSIQFRDIGKSFLICKIIQAYIIFGEEGNFTFIHTILILNKHEIFTQFNKNQKTANDWFFSKSFAVFLSIDRMAQ